MEDREAKLALRARHVKETAESVKRVNPSSNPTLEEIARFHDLHARHERELGHEGKARAAEERARHARTLLAKRP
jgi:hypothetical protein